MINGVGASPRMFVDREMPEPDARLTDARLTDVRLTDVATYASPRITGTGGFRITSQSAGRVAFDLNDGYSMDIDETSSAIFVANVARKESVQVWGHAQLALDGTSIGAFAGTTSVVLGNGTKITMETAPEQKSADVFRLDRLTVTRGNDAVVVAGVSQDVGGDLTVTQSRTGHTVDADTRDGLVLERNSFAQWADEYGIVVTPEMLAATQPGGAFGPGSTEMSREEFRSLIARFMSWGLVSSFLSLSLRSLASDLVRQDPNDVARTSEIHRAWLRQAHEAAAVTRSALRHADMRTVALGR